MAAEHHFMLPLSVRELTADDRAAQARLVRKAASFGPLTPTVGETFRFHRFGGKR